MNIVSRIVSQLSLSNGDTAILLKELRNMDITKGPFPPSVYAVKKFHLSKTKKWKITQTKINICVPETKEGVQKVLCPSHGLQVVHLDLWKVVESLFEDPEHARNAFWRYQPKVNDDGEQMYSELNTANWWKQMNEEHPGSDILPLIFSSDGCQVFYPRKATDHFDKCDMNINNSSHFKPLVYT